MNRGVLVSGALAAILAVAPSAHAAGPSAVACCVKLPLITWVTSIGSRRGAGDKPPVKPPVAVRRPHAPYRWDVGAWLAGMGLHGVGSRGEASAGVTSPTGFAGAGLQARHRIRRAWGLELSAGALHASTPGGGTGRDMFPVTASLMAYLKPRGFLQLYGLAGLGLAPTRWYVLDSDVTLGASTAGVAQAGGGITLALDPLRLHADLRATVVSPSMQQSRGRPPVGSLPCPTCGVLGTPAGAMRLDPKVALVGSALTVGASLVF